MRERTRTVERDIEAEPSAVWAYRLDFMNLSAYNPNVHGLERVAEAGPDGTGATYCFALDSPTGPHRVELAVTRIVPDHLVAIEMGGVLPAREELTITRTDGDGAPTDADGGATGGAGTPTGGAGRPDDGQPRSGPPTSRVAIELTLLIPDHFPESSDDALVDSGTEQVRAELDAMAARLETHHD